MKVFNSYHLFYFEKTNYMKGDSKCKPKGSAAAIDFGVYCGWGFDLEGFLSLSEWSLVVVVDGMELWRVRLGAGSG